MFGSWTPSTGPDESPSRKSTRSGSTRRWTRSPYPSAPSTNGRLQPRTCSTNTQLRITYQSYWREESYTFNVHPYCVKLFKQRWYLVALSPHLNRIMIYALDRIFDIAKLDGVTFTMPDDFYPEDFFYNYYGIIAGTNRKPEKVRLKVSASQANYLRSLPLHDTQEETERNEAFSIFTLRICPEFDFYQEILSNGEDVEVLEPKWMREEIGEIIHRMWNKYATTHNIING